MLQSGVEMNETPRNFTWMESLEQARFPQRPDGSQATTEVKLPIHDWTSHHRTATEYFAVNYQMPRVVKPTQAWSSDFGASYR